VVALDIPEGSSGRAVLDQLHDRGLLPSVTAGRLYLRAAGDGRWLHYGHYRLPAGSRPVDVLERLLDGRIEQLTVTVVEGSTVAETADQMTAAGVGSEAEWLAAAKRTEWIADLVPEAASLEGFLFPDTYQFAVGIGVDAAAHHLVQRFRLVWDRVRAAGPEPWGEPLEIVTLASMVEAETAIDVERRRIAGVFVNRLRRGMLLQCDPTVVYALKRRGEWHGRLLRIHWQVDDPYNTYRYPGLPPGPINSPGEAALRAALDPETHDYLYFVASPDGGHAFSETLADHNQAVAAWRRSRR
ncbi:MAG: endolytic transglycosylase MltG, partial [Holophagae bacterium]|jgi:UPF0755 protein